MADKEYEQSAHDSENENKDVINEQNTPENNGAFMNEGPPADETPAQTCEQSDEAVGDGEQSNTEDTNPRPEKKWIVVYDEDGNTDPEGPAEEPKAAYESAPDKPVEAEEPDEEKSEEAVEEVTEEPAEEEAIEETAEIPEQAEEAEAEEAADKVPSEEEEVIEEPVAGAVTEEPAEEIPEEVVEEITEETAEEESETIEESIEESSQEIEETAEEQSAPEEDEEAAEEVIIEEPEEEKSEETEEEIPEEFEAEESAEEETSEEDEGFEIFFDENGEVHLKGAKVKQQAEEQREYEEPQDDEEEVDPEDLVIHDEMITAIKAEGRRLKNTEASLKSYALHSKDAIRDLMAAMKAGKRALEENRDDKEAPVILAGIIRVCGKILEVRCNNLENYVRLKAYSYIKNARKALHEDIDEYNDLVINYSSLTGEQLTRLSTFLPENISAGKALSVVPTLTYKESYVQVFPDVEDDQGDVNTTVIEPATSAGRVLRDRKPPASRIGCSFYALRVRKAAGKLRREIARLTKLIYKTKSSRKKYESELHSLESRTPLAKRATQEYKNKVFRINAKYGRMLSGINTVKAASAFARTRVRLFVDRLAVERERLIVAYELLRNVYRCGSRSQRKSAERSFKSAIISYNKCAQATERVTGSSFEKIPASIIERACRGEEIIFPAVAYRRELVETVGAESRIISMALAEDIAPDEQAYAENAGKILDKHGTVKDTTCLSDEAAMVDRASAIARVMLSSLRESADMVVTADDLEQFRSRRSRAIKYFKRSLKATERAIARAFDEHGVVTALVENLRVIANLIEARRISISVEVRMGHDAEASSLGRALYKNIELYNGRAIDYMSIVGEQFSRITTVTAKELKKSAETLKVPVITYKDNYIEVFPKDPLKDSTYEKPRLWRSGVYTPLLMQHYRLTENRAVETTVVNSPFVFDVMVDDMPAVSWWHPIGFWQHLFVWAQPIVAWWNRVLTNVEIWFVDESLIFSKSGLKGRESRNGRKKSRYERKLARLNEKHTAQILALETVINDSDRHSASYQKKLYKINAKFSRKVYNLKVRWMRDCPGRNGARLLLERLVLERERLSGINKVLLKYRNYGRITFTRNVLVRYKKTFIKAITDHNATAAKLSELVGVKFAEVSTSVADEIVRYGKMIKFPEIVCCREVIETIDGKQRTVGDRWHGYGLYTGTSGAAVAANNPPVMSVGAMGYATDMGVPFLKADFDGMTMLGMTPGGVPLIGFSDNGETDIPFTGTPMMLSGQDSSAVLAAGGAVQDKLILGAANTADPYSGINTRAVDANYLDEAEEDAKDVRSGCNVETPLDLETKMIEERFQRALRARSMTTVDGVKTWWRLLGSEINVRIMRRLILRPRGFLRFLLPPTDGFIESVNTRVSRKDTEDLQNIAKLGSIIDIECKRFYSAVKVGIRRSQRVWSSWLHDDIERYNDLVREFNSGHERYMHLETLSLTIPDIIKNRSEDRPPAPPVLSLRNRVKLDENATPISTDRIYDRLVEFAEAGATKHAGFFRRIWSRLVTVPRIRRNYQRGKKAKVLSLVSRVIKRRTARTYLRRQNNEGRHYRIRYEKARAMKRYNRRNLRAIGVASDPIKYQTKAHKVLRKYLHNNFRIDYNMRIRQLIYRSLRIDTGLYVSMTIVLASILAIASIFIESSPSLRVLATIAICWTALPIIFLLLRIVYEIVMFIASCLLLVTRNIWLIKYGARDVERNRYGAILDCFVTEQYRLLLACEKLRQKPTSTSARKSLIATVNDYNKRAEVFSEILRVPIRAVETTGLIEKLTSGEKMHLTELQNFVYIRELVERVDTHKVGKKLSDRELTDLVDEINQIINGINVSGSDNEVAVDFLQGAMQKLIGYIQTDIKPTQNDRYELKRDLIQAINAFDIGYDSKERFAADVIKIVDQLGGRDRRRIIGVLAKDDMIF